MFLAVLPLQVVLRPSTNCMSPEHNRLCVLLMCIFRQPVSLSFVNRIIIALFKCLTNESPINVRLESRSDRSWQACSVVKFLNWQSEVGTNSCNSAVTVFLKSVHLLHEQFFSPDPHRPISWLQHGAVLLGSHKEGILDRKQARLERTFFRTAYPLCII